MDQFTNPTVAAEVSHEEVAQNSEAPKAPVTEKSELNIDEARADNLTFEQPPVQNVAVPAVDPVQVPTDPVADEEEVREEVGGAVDIKELPWLGKAKKIIKDLDEKPYDEEEACEELQQDYMKRRFGVTIKKEGDTK